MSTSEGLPRVAINADAIDDIRDYENGDIRGILENAGVLESGEIVSVEAYDVTKDRATRLARENKSPVSVEALLITAFVQRKLLAEHLTDEQIRNLPDAALRNVIYVETGAKLTDEEISMYRQSPLEFEQWMHARSAAKEGTDGTYVAVDGNDAVVARAPSSKEALRRAQDEKGR